LKIPDAILPVKLTLPVGASVAPGDASTTIAVHVVVWLIMTADGEQSIDVEELLKATLIVWP